MASGPPPPPSDLAGCSEQEYADLYMAFAGAPNPDEIVLALCSALHGAYTTTIGGRLEELEEANAAVTSTLDTYFLLVCGALVFVMHGGFAMLEAGAIRSKNAMSILLQTLLDASVSAIIWFVVGFAFAFGIGDNPNPFIGNAMFGLARYESHFTGSGTGNWVDWYFQWAFCATAATIPAGAVAERFNFHAYLGYSAFIAGFLYPVVVHWVWCSEGWLGYGTSDPILDTGMIDFAGSGVVHMVGGLAGLVGATLVGPRVGRFDQDGTPLDMPPHSAALVVLGTVLLWFGWYGFNPGSMLFISTHAASTVASRAAVTTILSGAAGGASCYVVTWLRTRSFDLYSLCNGVLCGFVAVTAGCHVLEPWAALLCGAGAGVIFDLACQLLLRLRIDDPLSAAPMHGCCGAWGVLFVGLLAKEEYIQQVYTRDSYPYGLFYGGNGKLLACQVIGVLVIAAWVVGLMCPFFLVFKHFGRLRVPLEVEHAGLDVTHHRGSAYNNLHHGSSAAGSSVGGGSAAGDAYLFGGSAHGGGDGVEAAVKQMQARTAAQFPIGTTVVYHHSAVARVRHQAGGGSLARSSIGDAIMRGETLGDKKLSAAAAAAAAGRGIRVRWAHPDAPTPAAAAAQQLLLQGAQEQQQQQQQAREQEQVDAHHNSDQQFFTPQPHPQLLAHWEPSAENMAPRPVGHPTPTVLMTVSADSGSDGAADESPMHHPLIAERPAGHPVPTVLMTVSTGSQHELAPARAEGSSAAADSEQQAVAQEPASMQRPADAQESGTAPGQGSGTAPGQGSGTAPEQRSGTAPGQAEGHGPAGAGQAGSPTQAM